MYIPHRCCGALAISLLFPVLAWAGGGAQPARWVPIGPNGGSIGQLAVDPDEPSTIYAATDSGGVYRSLDNGSTWSPANVGLGSGYVTGLTVDRSRSGRLFVATSSGLYLSNDAAVSWTRVDGLGAGINFVRTPVTSPAAPSEVYCIGESILFRSLDGGETWSRLDDRLPLPHVISIALSATAPPLLYAGGESALFRSEDHGESWTPVDMGSHSGVPVEAIFVDPSNSDRLFIVAGGTLVASFDGGATFVDTVTPDTVTSALVDPADPDVVYATTVSGAARSIDGGLRWEPLDSGLPMGPNPVGRVSAASLLLLEQPSRRLLAGTRAGLYAFDLPNGPWQSAGRGLTPVVVTDLAIPSQAPGTIHVAAEDGVYRTLDAGQTWRLSFFGSLFASFGGVAVDPNDKDLVYVGGYGLWGSVDGGDDWSYLGGPIVGQLSRILDILTLTLDPNSPQRIFFGGVEGAFVADLPGPVGRRLELGAAVPYVTSIVVDPTSSRTVYVGTLHGVFKSDNGGQTFRSINQVAQGADGPLAQVSAIAIDPMRPSVLYAGTRAEYGNAGAGVFRTLDGGNLWTQVNEGLAGRDVLAIAPDPLFPSTVYAGTEAGVYRSVDGGQRWSPLTSLGISGRLPINTLLPETDDPSATPSLLAGSNQGILRLQLPNVGTFAQFGDGASESDSFSSELILFNPSDQYPANASLLLRDGQGSDFQVEFDGAQTNGRLDLDVPARALRVFKTSGDGPLRTGWAALHSDRPLEGVVVFESRVGSAGVSLSQASIAGFTIPVRTDVARNIRTGLALANLATVPNRIDLELLDANHEALGRAEIPLSSLGQEAVFIDEIPWLVESGPIDFSNFLGLVSARGQSPVAAMALQTEPGEFATFPVLDADDSGSPEEGPGVPLHFPHFANGAAAGQHIVSSLLLVNKNPVNPARAVIDFRDSGGVPVGSRLFPGSGDTLDLEIPAGGVRDLETDGLGEIVSGSVTVSADQPLDGVLIYTGEAGAAGIGQSPSFDAGWSAPVETDFQTGVNTGLAMMNLEEDATSAQLTLHDENGLELASATVDLPARGQKALFVDQIDWSAVGGMNLDFSSFRGFVQAVSSGRSRATVIRTRPEQFAAFPVAPLP